MADDNNQTRKIRIELLDGTVEVTGSEGFVRRAQAVFMKLVSGDITDVAAQRNSGEQLFSPSLPASSTSTSPIHGVTDIRSLKDQKQPRNLVEMAALVAHYVSNLAPESDRRDTITAQDITKYFGHAGYPTTMQPRMILYQAKNAGYLDSPSTGEYKLNPVGYNLVTAGLPSDAPAAPRRRRIAAKRAPAKSRKKK
jgi:hypothetical protein